jgi:CHAT domain-containing protein
MDLPDARTDMSRMVDRRMALAREWDELVEQVRGLDGFEDFLKPPRLETLLPAAANGPVVVVNVSRWRCDALIVRTKGIEVKELSSLTLEAVEQHATDYLRVLQRADQAVHTVYQARRRIDNGDHTPDAIRQYTEAKQAQQATQRDRERTLQVVMEWLWDEIAGPVLAALSYDDTPRQGKPWPRMWWCATGPLTLLPLHAAGYHSEADQSPRRTVLDRVVSSYTPTLRALLGAMRTGATNVDNSRMLVVALPNTPNEIPLPEVTRERDLLGVLFAGRQSLLEGKAATWEAVRIQLERHRWVHFSCHADQNLTDPSRGGLLLHDRMLTIADIGARQYDGDFVFLSACKTAIGGLTLPDEAITLAAALHYTGYRHVIATMWSVYDFTAADVAEAVYTDLMSSGEFVPDRAARALHDAVRHLRDEKRLPLSAWTPFTHTGP